MDIKDFILIGGGLLIAAVIAHGFWIAWRARRDPLRLDIVPDIVPKKLDELAGLRSELPNGGGRVIRRSGTRPEQASLELDEDAALLLEPLHSDADDELPARLAVIEAAERSDVSDAAAGSPPKRQPDASAEPRISAGGSEKRTEPRLEPSADAVRGALSSAAGETVETARGGVADVVMPDQPIVAEDPKEPRRWSGRRLQAAPPAEESSAALRSPSPQQERDSGRERDPQRSRDLVRGNRKDRGQSSARGSGSDASSAAVEPAVQELIVINVLAARGQRFEGPALVQALRARGLRYGEMNIFHRVEPLTRAIQYSVASVLEPGTFDMAEIEEFRSPGVCFFMQLPGPEHPLETFEDMLAAARYLALQLGGELKDEQRSVMTGQTVEHYRQRIADFRRRAMSMRA